MPRAVNPLHLQTLSPTVKAFVRRLPAKHHNEVSNMFMRLRTDQQCQQTLVHLNEMNGKSANSYKRVLQPAIAFGFIIGKKSFLEATDEECNLFANLEAVGSPLPMGDSTDLHRPMGYITKQDRAKRLQAMYEILRKNFRKDPEVAGKADSLALKMTFGQSLKPLPDAEKIDIPLPTDAEVDAFFAHIFTIGLPLDHLIVFDAALKLVALRGVRWEGGASALRANDVVMSQGSAVVAKPPPGYHGNGGKRMGAVSLAKLTEPLTRLRGIHPRWKTGALFYNPYAWAKKKDRVFEPLSLDTLRSFCKRVSEAAGLDYTLTPKVLRVKLVRRLLVAGHSIEEVQRILFHRMGSDTIERYARFNEEDIINLTLRLQPSPLSARGWRCPCGIDNPALRPECPQGHLRASKAPARTLADRMHGIVAAPAVGRRA